MKKLMCIFITFLSINSQQIRAQDEWDLAIPLVVTSGALLVSACYMYKQSRTIVKLEADIATKNSLIESLTQERDKLKTTSIWESIADKLCSYIPFLCIKESITPDTVVDAINGLNFKKSDHPHKIPGLVTYISLSTNFTSHEKNMVSDEEDALENREYFLDDIDTTLAQLKDKVGGFGNKSSESLQ